MILKIKWHHADKLCAMVSLDYDTHSVSVNNFTDNPLDKPFGNKSQVSWQDAMEFLEWRCFERRRQDSETILKLLDFSNYNPVWIIQTTKGRLEGDSYWLDTEIVNEN